MAWWIVMAFGPNSVSGGLGYVSTATFDPATYGALAWPQKKSSMKLEGGDWYNPSLAKLPKGWNATYLGAFERNLQTGNCWNLMNDTSFWGLDDDREPATFVLFNDAFDEVRRLDLRGDEKLLEIIRICGDVRLESGMHRKWILAHAHCRWTYVFWWLDGETVRPFDHKDKIAPWLQFRAQNLGVLWDGKPRSPFRILYWLSDPLDVRTGIPPKEMPAGDEETRLLNGATPELFERSLHNSGSPVSLDDWCPGMSLALGHSHLDDAVPAYAKRNVTTGTTRWGNTYLSNFVLFNATDLKTLRVSSPFCFPTDDDDDTAEAPRCDVIQFVTTFARFDRTSDLVHIAYGVNDCESTLRTVHIAEILDFIGLSSEICPGVSSDDETTAKLGTTSEATTSR